MPERIEPCLATLAAKPPAGPHWAFEVKWDGCRLHVHVKPSGVRVITCGGHDWTHRFLAIAAAVAELGAGTAILDGEAVVLTSTAGPTIRTCYRRSAAAAASGSLRR